jgi:rhodanese-related sulfurtransferase
MKRVYIVLSLLSIIVSIQAYTTISADTLQRWITIRAPFNFLLIDVRDPGEGTLCIATDSCLPYNMSWNLQVFRQNTGKLLKDTAIIIYCAHGSRGALAAALLDSLGFHKVYNLSGGFSNWTGPTKSVSNYKPLSLLPQLSMHAGTAAVLYFMHGMQQVPSSTHRFLLEVKRSSLAVIECDKGAYLINGRFSKLIYR